MKLEDLKKDTVLTVLGDASHVYVIPDEPVEAGVHVNTNLLPGTGLRGLNVNGRIYAFPLTPDAHYWEARPLVRSWYWISSRKCRWCC